MYVDRYYDVFRTCVTNYVLTLFILERFFHYKNTNVGLTQNGILFLVIFCIVWLAYVI